MSCVPSVCLGTQCVACPVVNHDNSAMYMPSLGQRCFRRMVYAVSHQNKLCARGTYRWLPFQASEAKGPATYKLSFGTFRCATANEYLNAGGVAFADVPQLSQTHRRSATRHTWRTHKSGAKPLRDTTPSADKSWVVRGARRFLASR